ncbi:MAG: serine/threonine protein phosphatase [Hymenobacter sp.]|nr:MAG: serine/threonine protein phosphatase [Hymenobacter sp.]
MSFFNRHKMPRRFAATDIHGCLETFSHLVEKELRLHTSDTLYLLGDYVNKGPDSAGVLDYIMALQGYGYHIHCLRGNHDDALLKAGDSDNIWKSEAEREMTLDSFGAPFSHDIPVDYRRWLDKLPFDMVLPDFVLVHAGYNFALPPTEMRRDYRTMLTTKSFTFDPSRLGGKRLLHGHVPTPVAEIKAAVAARAGAIGLDAGGVYRHNPELRHLAALNIDSWELHLVENRELPYPITVR